MVGAGALEAPTGAEAVTGTRTVLGEAPTETDVEASALGVVPPSPQELESPLELKPLLSCLELKPC